MSWPICETLWLVCQPELGVEGKVLAEEAKHAGTGDRGTTNLTGFEGVHAGIAVGSGEVGHCFLLLSCDGRVSSVGFGVAGGGKPVTSTDHAGGGARREDGTARRWELARNSWQLTRHAGDVSLCRGDAKRRLLWQQEMAKEKQRFVFREKLKGFETVQAGRRPGWNYYYYYFGWPYQKPAGSRVHPVHPHP